MAACIVVRVHWARKGRLRPLSGSLCVDVAWTALQYLANG